MALSPISFMFIAAAVGQRARLSLTRFKPSQVNPAPSWDGHDGALQGSELSLPITDRSYWEGRFVLTEILLRKDDGEELLINDATVSISREKSIVRTQLAGLDGTIKEYICNGDYDIDINVGIVAVEDGQIVDDYPSEGIRKVREFLDENKSVSITSEFFRIFDITRVVFTKFSVRQDTHTNRQLIEVKALSDDDYVIKSTAY